MRTRRRRIDWSAEPSSSDPCKGWDIGARFVAVVPDRSAPGPFGQACDAGGPSTVFVDTPDAVVGRSRPSG